MHVRVERVSFWFFAVSLVLGFRAGFTLLAIAALAVLAKKTYDLLVTAYSTHATPIFSERRSNPLL
jgi:hypothetical protein